MRFVLADKAVPPLAIQQPARGHPEIVHQLDRDLAVALPPSEH